ncbi:hypothetical protein COB57_02540 [Candidatus Peregrinibacteria bacterium]|nr:MAG: hypothetical protein COB57_02540 [Candidatus Peregrinibacteria bacterium]
MNFKLNKREKAYAIIVFVVSLVLGFALFGGFQKVRDMKAADVLHQQNADFMKVLELDGKTWPLEEGEVIVKKINKEELVEKNVQTNEENTKGESVTEGVEEKREYIKLTSVLGSGEIRFKKIEEVSAWMKYSVHEYDSWESVSEAFFIDIDVLKEKNSAYETVVTGVLLFVPDLFEAWEDYIVKKEDTWKKLAEYYSVDGDVLRLGNSEKNLVVGDIIRVPSL